MSDGKIRIDVDLNNKNAKADLADLEKMCDQTAEHIKQSTATILNSKGKPIKLIDVKNDSGLSKAKDRIAQLRAEIEKTEAETNKMLNECTTDEQASAVMEMEEKQLQSVRAEYDELTQRVKVYEQAKAEAMAQKAQGEATKQAGADAKVQADADAFVGKISSLEQYNKALNETQMKLNAIEQASQRIANERGVNVDEVLRANSEYTKLKTRYDALISASGKFKASNSDAMASASKAVDKLSSGIHKGIKKMIKYTLAIFGARSAFFFLKSVMSSFIQDNEELSNSIAGIKGALGEMLGPAITRIINLAKTAMAYVNAFIKALTGVDFVARYNAKALAKQTKATGGLTKAQKENQRQSAGFDEQNKLSDPSSGASADASASAGTLELPEVSGEALKKIQDFAKWLKPIYEWLTKNTDAVKIFGASVAGAFAGLEFAKWLGDAKTAEDILTKLGGAVSKLFGGALVAGGIFLIVDAIKDIAKNGPNANNILKILAGTVMVLVGAILIFNASLLASPVTWIVIGIMALIAAIALCIVYWDDIKAKAVEVITSIKKKLDPVFQWVKDHIIDPIVNAVKPAVQTVVNVVMAIVTKCKEIFNTIVQIFNALGKAFMTYIVTPIVNNFNTYIKTPLSKFGSWLYNVAIKPFVDIVKNIWGTVKPYLTDLKNNAVTFFKNIGKTVVDFMGNLFKSVVNGIFASIENRINGFIKMLNGAVELINKIPNVNIKKVAELKLPRLAQGGIVNNPGRGVQATIGEAGAEAVLPLERNTGWIDMLAERINGNGGPITIPIYLDGKLIAKQVINRQNKFKFATNGGVI